MQGRETAEAQSEGHRRASRHGSEVLAWDAGALTGKEGVPKGRSEAASGYIWEHLSYKLLRIIGPKNFTVKKGSNKYGKREKN